MNKSHSPRLGMLALAAALPLLFAACDLAGTLSDIENDFNLIIELPPINNVVSGQILDVATNEPIRQSVTLTFSGEHGGRIIDAYSDPVTKIDAKNGVVSFGIDNALSPSESSPVKFEVTAKAEGYFTNSKGVVITEAGGGGFVLLLTRVDVSQQIRGTSGTEDQSASASAGSGVAQQVTVATPQHEQTRARATIQIANGTVPTTKAGTALNGQLRTQLRVFDPNQGLSALPQGAQSGASGSKLAIAGAAFFKMSDAAGNIATGFQGGSAGKTQAQCDGGVTLRFDVSDASLVSAYQLLKAQNTGAQVLLDVYAYTPADQQNSKVGQVELVEESGGVRASICLGGAAPSIDVALLGDASEGYFVTVALAGGQVESCQISAKIAGTNPNAFVVPISQIALVGPGVNIQALSSFSANPGSGTYSLAAVLGQSQMTRVIGAKYIATASVSGQSAGLVIDNPCADQTHSLTLPTIAGSQTYTVNASLACPVGQQFEVQLTAQSVDALGVSYRRKGAGEPYISIRNLQRSMTTSSVNATATLTLQPNTTYELFAVYDTDATSAEVTTPAEGGTIPLDFMAADAGMTCRPK